MRIMLILLLVVGVSQAKESYKRYDLSKVFSLDKTSEVKFKTSARLVKAQSRESYLYFNPDKTAEAKADKAKERTALHKLAVERAKKLNRSIPDPNDPGFLDGTYRPKKAIQGNNKPTLYYLKHKNQTYRVESRVDHKIKDGKRCQCVMSWGRSPMGERVLFLHNVKNVESLYSGFHKKMKARE